MTRRSALGALLLLSLAGPAAAHSELRRATPPDGATLAAAPEAIELEFNERVQLTALRLFGADGAEIRLPPRGPIRAAREETIRLPPLVLGEYRAEWRALSADGHPIGGTLRFRIRQP